jgi:hypothetical protein
MARTLPTEKETTDTAFNRISLYILLAAGLLLRLRLAWSTFLNPDEALHYFLARQASLSLAYRASLTTAHPPLMILFLHYWSAMGNSEIFLRLPFVVAGTGFCWVMFLWVRQIADACAAWFAVALFLFLPPLISLSAEIRQYSFLLLFCALCLYFLERGLNENSSRKMVLSVVFLWLGLFTHYSALIFALAAGGYALSRILSSRFRFPLIMVWGVGQAVAVGICAFLYESQISPLRRAGVLSEIASTWLSSSIFHGGKTQVVSFAWSRSVRLFRYFFSNGTIGSLALLLFIFAIVGLAISNKNIRQHSRALALLLVLPFFIAFAAAIGGAYPYGGTRHDIILALFAIPAIAIALDQLPVVPGRSASIWAKAALVGCGLIIGNFFPTPTGPYIRPRDQRRELMQAAMNSLRSLPANSVIFTEDQGSVTLNYYLCAEPMALPFYSPAHEILKFRCGDNNLLVATGTPGGFDRAEFSRQLSEAWQAVPNSTELYLFQSGWINDKEQDWTDRLRQLGGDPQNFGRNILICRINQSEENAAK